MKIQSLKILLVLMTALCVVLFFATGFAQEPKAGSDPAGTAEPSLSNEMPPISDLTMLQFSGEAQTVTITGNQLDSLEPLTQYGELKAVILDHCNVVDLEPLSRCAALESLTIIGGSGWDLSPVASIQTLTSLTLSDLNDTIVNFSGSSADTKLETLSLRGMNLTNDAALFSWAAGTLTSLTLTDCIVSEQLCTVIGTCEEVTELSISNVDGISFLPVNTSSLTTLIVDQCTGMDGLSNLINAAQATLAAVKITNCTMGIHFNGSLTTMQVLSELTLQNVTELAFPFQGSLPSLTALVIGQTDLTNAAPLFRAAAGTLASLSLTDCTVNEEICTVIGACGKLTELMVTNVQGVSFPDGSANNVSLTTLIIDQCMMGMNGFANMLNGASGALTTIKISNSTMGIHFNGSMISLQKLSELTLQNVTELSFPFAGSSPSLSSVILEQTDLSNAAPLLQSAAGSLTSLTITDCTANAEFGGAIGACKKLKELIIFNAEGLGFPDGCANKALATLIVSQTNMLGFSPLVAGAVTALTSVEISDCSMGQDVCSSLTVCGKLKELTLRNVTRMSFLFKGSNPLLSAMTIEQTDMTDGAPWIQAAAKALKSLTIKDSYLGEEFCAALGTCGKLASLTLQNVTGLEIPDGYANKLLKTLSISRADPSVSIAPLIEKAAKTLASLTIADSSVDDAFCAALGACVKLKELHIAGVEGLSFPEECANKVLAALTVEMSDMRGCAPLITGASKILASVSITDSSVDEAFCAALGACAKLKELKIVSVEGLRFPEGCANKALASLTVDDCDMKGCAPLITGASKILSSIIITNSSVDEDVCSAIGACTKIKTFIAQDVADLDIQRILSLWAAKPKS